MSKDGTYFQEEVDDLLREAINGVFEEIEKKLKAGSYQSGTYHYYGILYETWQSLKSKPVKEYLK